MLLTLLLLLLLFLILLYNVKLITIPCIIGSVEDVEHWAVWTTEAADTKLSLIFQFDLS
jgi:hypothetical protein